MKNDKANKCVVFQFYRCFLILFHCKHSSLENGQSSMPSKTTAIQLNRRVYNNTVAGDAPPSADLNQHKSSPPVSDGSNPPEITTWCFRSTLPHDIISQMMTRQNSSVEWFILEWLLNLLDVDDRLKELKVNRLKCFTRSIWFKRHSSTFLHFQSKWWPRWWNVNSQRYICVFVDELKV